MGKRSAYISGPMTGYSMSNFPMFYHAEKMLQDKEWVVYNPARMDEKGGWPTPDTPPALRECARRDLLVIIDCLKLEDCDAMVMLPHWQFSKGARTEHALAEWLGIEILTLEEACK